jgi:hypothetical protein
VHESQRRTQPVVGQRPQPSQLGVAEVRPEHLQEEQLGVLAYREGGPHPLARYLLDQPIDARAQGGRGGIGCSDERHGRQRLRQQRRTGRVEFDVTAEDDVVDGEIRVADAQGVLPRLGLELHGRTVTGAALGAQPRAAGQDRDVAGLIISSVERAQTGAMPTTTRRPARPGPSGPKNAALGKYPGQR